MHSEIFEEFVKIVNAADEQKKEKSKDKKSVIKEIAELYNLKPETHPDMDYENNMAEIAHKEPMVMSPAYDKSNGLIENVNEGHSLIKEVVTRDPRGQHTNRRVSAKEELIKNLVRLGNDLDFNGHEKLAILADDCLNKLTIKKEAFAWAAIPWLVGGALSILSVNKHLPEANLGLVRNSDNLVSELEDVVTSNANFGIGKKYKGNFIKFIVETIKNINNFKSAYNKGFSAFNSLKITSAKDILENSEEVKKNTEENEKVLSTLLSATTKMKEYVEKISALFNDENFINEQVETSGGITEFIEKNKALNLFSNLTNPFDDIVEIQKSFNSYLESLNDIISTIENGGKAKEQYTSITEQMLGKFNVNKSNSNKNSNDVDISDLAGLK